MAVQAIDWLDAPSATDLFDSTRYAMGVEFTVSEPVPCPGVRWRVPDTLTPVPGAGYVVSLFQAGVGLIRQQEIDPTPGGDEDFLWLDEGPVTLEDGETYTAQVYTERYVFRGSSSYPYATPNGIATAVRGMLTENVSSPATEATSPATGSRFYVSPLIGTVDDDAITATLTINLPALDAELAGTAAIAATLGITLPALDAALSVDVDGGPALMGLAAVMEEIKGVLAAATPRFRVVHPGPVPSLGELPAAIVAFPEGVTYDLTNDHQEQYRRIAVFAVAGDPSIGPKTLRERISGWMTGPTSIKVLLEAHAWTTCSDVLVHEDAEPAVEVTIGGIGYISGVIYLDATGYGA